MERSERVINSIKRALLILEYIMKALASGKGEVEQALWQAATETEYAASLLSLLEKAETHPWKIEASKIGKVEVGQALTTAQDLLKEAEKIANSNFEEAYQKAWTARQYIQAAQQALSGKHKKRS